MPFWVPVAIAAIAAAAVLWVDILGGRRKRTNSRRDAAESFRFACTDAIAKLNGMDAHSFITESRAQHDAAISAFRCVVDTTRIHDYDVAAEAFNQRRSEIMPAPLKVLASLESGKPVDNSDIVKLKAALSALLAFADSTHER